MMSKFVAEMMKLAGVCVCLCVLVALTHCAREADRVTSLPGLDDPQPTFRHYAGHLDATDGKKLFYW